MCVCPPGVSQSQKSKRAASETLGAGNGGRCQNQKQAAATTSSKQPHLVPVHVPGKVVLDDLQQDDAQENGEDEHQHERVDDRQPVYLTIKLHRERERDRKTERQRDRETERVKTNTRRRDRHTHTHEVAPCSAHRMLCTITL